MDIRKYFGVKSNKNVSDNGSNIEKNINPQLDNSTKIGLSNGISDGLNNKLQKKNKIWKVFTDGSTIGNGKRGAKGGIGVFFADLSPDNIGEKMETSGRGKPVTNNFCELEAVRRAILVIINKPEFNEKDIIQIYTDSQYLIDCITLWSNTWMKNGWKRKKGGQMVSIKNKELIQNIKMNYTRYSIRFIKVKAHCVFMGEKDLNNPEYYEWYGNFMADKLANEAASY